MDNSHDNTLLALSVSLNSGNNSRLRVTISVHTQQLPRVLFNPVISLLELRTAHFHFTIPVSMRGYPAYRLPFPSLS